MRTCSGKMDNRPSSSAIKRRDKKNNDRKVTEEQSIEMFSTSVLSDVINI